MSGLTVVARVSSPRCRICASGQRDKLEALYGCYLNGEPDPITAEKVTWKRLTARASVLVGETCSERGTRRHLEDHADAVGEKRAAELQVQADEGDEERDQLVAELDALLNSGGDVSPAGLLSLQMKVYLQALRDSLASGERLPTITHDQAARAAEKMLSAAKRQEEATLLHCLTAGISQVFQREFGPGSANPPPDVIEIEAVKVEEEDETA